MDCEICGEHIKASAPGDWLEPVGEFWDPTKPEEGSVIAHAECGLSRGLEVA